MEQEQGMILLNTDVLINLYDERKANYATVNAVLTKLLAQEVALYVSIVTEIELLQGSKPLSERKRLLKQLQSFEQLLVTEKVSVKAKELIIQYSSSHDLLLGDSLIAATALEAKLPLYSFNKKDFRFIAGLQLYEP